MKKLSYFIVFIISILLFSNCIYASSIVVITGEGVNMRTNPSTSSKIITAFSKGKELSLIDKDIPKGNGCNAPWYKVEYNSNIGYVCSEYATIKEIIPLNPNDYKDYTDYLTKLGFPSTYFPYIISLHEKHPNWQFQVFNSNLDFTDTVKKEYDGYSKGWSLFEDTGSYYDGYKSTDSWSYNYLTNIFSNNFTGGGKYWYAANKETIAYYLDPRNFINEKQIFMFESLSYNKDYHTKEGIETMLKNTFMSQKIADTENNLTYADAFLDAAIKYNISPYVLISRVIQEVGANGSTIVSGTVPGYEGYYNFYNIKAYGNSSTETINNGLEHAKKEDWNTPYKAILGGGSFLSDGYISVGQDSLYLQKWDLVGPTYITHQYMQNIEAPANESIKTYKGYNNINLLDSNFVFTIPVFKNMPEKTNLPNSGNPNNYLSSLSINGNYLFETATNENNFDIVLDVNTKSIDIAATKVSNKSNISGTGSIALSGTNQTVKLVVTAENGAKRDYTINITRSGDKTIDISELLRILEIKNDGTYIYGYGSDKDINEVIKLITDKTPKAEVIYKNKEGKEKKEGIISSYDTITIKTDREEKEYTFIIYGDVSGDGVITASDYVMIKNHIMDVKKLSNLETLAADANKDGNVNSSDYVTIKNHIMDIKKIEW